MAEKLGEFSKKMAKMTPKEFVVARVTAKDIEAAQAGELRYSWQEE